MRCEATPPRRSFSVSCAKSWSHSSVTRGILARSWPRPRVPSDSASTTSRIGRFDRDVSGHRLPLECLDDPFRRDDFTVLTAEGGLAPIGLTNDVPPAATWPDVHLVDRRRVPARAPPPRDEVGVRHRFEHEIAGGVELPRDQDLPVRRECDFRGCSATYRGHLSSPYLFV